MTNKFYLIGQALAGGASALEAERIADAVIERLEIDSDEEIKIKPY